MKRPPLSGDQATEAALPAAEELPWTGERLVPSQTGQVATEHLHRYAIACALAQGKDVLDIACGEGYGSALLGRTARSVVGVDIDAESVQHAGRKYGSSKVRFLLGECRAIPLGDASVDLVVSFETIEHIAQHDDFLEEVRRVLRKGGRFIVSTPDKKNYGDSRDTDNPFHVRELSYAEFRDVLTARFKRVRFLGQRFAAVSVVLDHDSVKPLKLEMFTGNYQGAERSHELVAPTYLLAVCADGPLPPLPEGLFEFRDAPASHVPQSEFVAQLFGGDGSGYSGARSITQAVIPGAWQTVRFEHVERVHPDGRYRLRIDPINAAAFVELASLRVIRDADKAVIYSAESAAEFAGAEFSGNVLAHSVDRRLVLLATDADPQIYLPPLGDFQGRSSYSLELTFRVETAFAGIVQSHHALLTRNRELGEAVDRWRTQAERLEAAEAAWGQSHADLRVALESSRVDAGRLESQLALATSDARRLLGQVEELKRSLADREEDASRRQRELEARAEELNRSLAHREEDASRRQRELESQVEELHRSLAHREEYASRRQRELEAKVEELNRSLARREEDASRRRRELEAKVEELNRSLAHREEDASRRQRELEAQVEESSRRQREVDGLHREADTASRELLSLRESLSWRLTLPLRSVHRFLARQRRSLRKRGAEVRELYVRAAVRLHPTRRLKELRKLTKLVRRSSLLDEQWYLSQYKRLVPKTADPVLHYLRYGCEMHFDPNAFFASRYYLESNPDVAAKGVNPLVHYILSGWKEGRDPSLTFSLRQYLNANPGVDSAGLEPLAHYLRQRRQDNASPMSTGAGTADMRHPTSQFIARDYFATREESAHPDTVVRQSADARLADVKLIAFYLPQFHPIPENDRAWGRGFTEWTNVTKAAPLFKGHYQPHLPADLGFCDLRVAETREAQADLARSYGIFGFCYYYYWFDRERLLQRPLDEVLQSGRPDFPFCICWANEAWSRRWDGSEHEVIASQKYGDGFAERFIRDVLPILQDPRYIRVNGRPLLVVYRVDQLPDPAQVAKTWRQICRDEGVGEICLAAVGSFGMSDPRPFGFEVLIEMPPHDIWSRMSVGREFRIEDELEELSHGFTGAVRDYRASAAALLAHRTEYPRFRGLMVSWDNSPRRGKMGHVFHNSSPAAYEQWLRGLLAIAAEASDPYPPFIFVNAWNEWGEGTHLEPDQQYGRAYLEATAAALNSHVAADEQSRDANEGQVQTSRGEARQEKSLRRRYRHLFEATAYDAAILPHVSIIIPVFNGVELSLDCLNSLHGHRSRWPYEVLIVDDGSSDLTQGLLSGLSGVRYLRSDQNRGFVASCNHGAKQARGEFLVFLNNDTVLLDGWLDALRETFLYWPHAGLVGSKLVLPSGRLQECGSLLYRDGSAANYGRDGDPDDPRYCFVRETDYVSGAAIMIPRELFFRLGSFDERYAPAYYEDTDLAMRVRQAGLQVLVNPHAVVLHREGGTAGTDLNVGAKRYQTINQAKFFDRWREVLASYPEREAVVQLRSQGRRILVIDWAIPRPDRDAGSVRMAAIIRILREFGFQITFAARDLSYDPEYGSELERIGVEVLRRENVASMRQYLEQSGGSFAYVVISRRDVAKMHMEVVKELCSGAKIIFDTVDLHFAREAGEQALESPARSDDTLERNRIEELTLVKRADVTVVVSAAEREVLRAAVPDRDIRVVSIINEARPTSPPFRDRAGIMFIGYFLHKPNVDGLLWFVREVMPLLGIGADDFRLHVVGSDPPKEVQALASTRIQIHGFVRDVTPLFEVCKFSIAPLRYGAGVKGKIGQSLALGVPCVMTSIAADGMGIRDGENGLLADAPAEFARKVRQLYGDEQLWNALRRGGIDLVNTRFSAAAAQRELRELFGLDALGVHRSGHPHFAHDQPRNEEAGQHEKHIDADVAALETRNASVIQKYKDNLD